MKGCIPYVLVCLLYSQEKIHAQINLYPAPLGQVAVARTILNPSLVNLESATTATLSNQFYTGSYSTINNLACIGTLGLSKRDSFALIKHSLGIKFINEMEGEYISRTKYYLSYCWHTRLIGNYWLGTGLDVGRAAYIFKGTNVSSLGSDSDWDGDLGIAIYTPRMTLAGSVNQFFDAKILPKELFFRWKRFFSVYGSKSFFFANSSSLSIFAQHLFIQEDPSRTDIGIQYNFPRFLGLGGNILWNRKISFFVTCRDFQLENHKLSLSIGYNAPIGSLSSGNIHSFEIALQYFFR